VRKKISIGKLKLHPLWSTLSEREMRSNGIAWLPIRPERHERIFGTFWTGWTGFRKLKVENGKWKVGFFFSQRRRDAKAAAPQFENEASFLCAFAAWREGE